MRMAHPSLLPHVDRYLAQRRNQGTLTRDSVRNQRCVLYGLAQSFGRRPVARLSRRDIDRYLETIGHLAPATRRQRLSTVRTFCAWLVLHRTIGRDPTVGIPSVRQPRHVPRALPQESVALVFASLPDLRAHAIVALMVYCGLRCCEVAHLEMADYDPADKLLTVRGKGGHERVLPIPDECAAVLGRYLRSQPACGGPLVRSKRNAALGLAPNTISRMVAQWMAAAGVKQRARDGVSAHAYRHTCASEILDRCHDVTIVQRVLGHAHLSTSAIYLRRAGLDTLREAMSGRDYSVIA
jgi:site-specific recombinase XerC